MSPRRRGERYRVKTTKSGKRVRLGFVGNKVVEAKRLHPRRRRRR